jgi:hypothetical protein
MSLQSTPRWKKWLPIASIAVAVALLGLLFGTRTEGEWATISAESKLPIWVERDTGASAIEFVIDPTHAGLGFDPADLWFAMVSECSMESCVGETLRWRISFNQASSAARDSLLRRSDDGGRYRIPYGMARWGEVVQNADSLIPGRCYYVTVRVDTRVGRAAFIVDRDTVLFGRINARPENFEECERTAQGAH